MKLNDRWTMTVGGRQYPCRVPCSLYDTLYHAGEIPDPYFGENEYALTALSDQDVLLERGIELPGDLAGADRLYLTFEGIDTLGEVRLNGQLLGCTDNMHRTWEYEIGSLLQPGVQRLSVLLRSPNRYIAERQTERPLWGVDSTMPGYPHLRKAHYMFGWDWGPKLPDLGLWRGVRLEGYTGGRIRDMHIRQRHEQGRVILSCAADLDIWSEGLTACWEVTAPDGQSWSVPLTNGRAELTIEHPQLWWVRGLGEQPLYLNRVRLMKDGVETDAREQRLGLRTLTVLQKEDQWGHEFCFAVNGVRVFAMGANYIPEDQILPRCTAERTKKLLSDCEQANYNFIRVWGGGLYPDDWFYDWCDEHGFIVWQDFMFACSAYRLAGGFGETVRQEVIDNVRRLRHHPSLGLWCGNNEIESAWVGWGLPEDPEAKADYTRLFEELIPELLGVHDPDTFYWPSSPSSGGGFKDPSSNLAGDMHYWAVWHSFKPIEAFRAFYYRFCSEYGFESVPDLRTVRAFAGEGDLDLCSPAIEAHQKCTLGNEKIMFYLAQMVNYPRTFERLIYCSQFVQAESIRSDVEHMRRARGRCMGSAYWQVNDSNPVISWSSIDYFGRWKALHYAARRFYAPVLLSCDDTDPLHPVLYMTNDTRETQPLTVVCRLRDRSAAVLKEVRAAFTAEALSAAPCLNLDLSSDLNSLEDKRTKYLEYVLTDENGCALGAGTTLFTRVKSFRFLPAEIRCEVSEEPQAFAITLRANAFVKSLCLSLRDADAVFSDNWFDLHGDEPVTVTLPKDGELQGMSADDVRNLLVLEYYNDGN